MGFFSGIIKSIGKLFGGDGGDLAKQQKRQIDQQAQQAKLNASNEVMNVTQFDETTDPSFVGAPEVRKKKRDAGAYASGIGLQI